MIRNNIDSIYTMMDPVSTDRDVFQNVVNFLCSLAGVQTPRTTATSQSAC